MGRNSKTKVSGFPPSGGERQFAELAEFYEATSTNVDRVKLFGYDCLRVEGKVFAKLHNGHLVMKFPLQRASALIGSNCAGPFMCRGRMMKEWAIVDAGKNIIDLAEEAREFVRKE